MMAPEHKSLGGGRICPPPPFKVGLIRALIVRPYYPDVCAEIEINNSIISPQTISFQFQEECNKSVTFTILDKNIITSHRHIRKF